MFSRLMERAKSTVSHLVEKQLLRASVAIPAIICLGYVLAAATATLADAYGWKEAYWIMAGALGVLAIVMAITIAIREHREEVEAEAQPGTAAKVAADVIVQTPSALARSSASPEFVLPTAAGRVRVPVSLVLIVVALGSVLYAVTRSETRSPY
jgi:hypothetical protein